MSSVVEGRNAVLEALRSGMTLKRIMIATGMNPNKAIDEIVALAKRARVPLESVSRKQLDALSDRGAHQGVIAEGAPFSYTPLDTVLRETAGAERSLIIVLDHVTDPGNLGAVIRSAEVAGADAVVIPKDRAAAVTPSVFKASAGAVSHMPIVQETNLVRALETLKGAEYWVGGAAGEAKARLWEAPLDGRLVMVMGAEGAGISRLVRKNCDFLVSLPVAGQVDSLNVAQATSVFAFEWVRRGTSGS